MPKAVNQKPDGQAKSQNARHHKAQGPQRPEFWNAEEAGDKGIRGGKNDAANDHGTKKDRACARGKAHKPIASQTASVVHMFKGKIANTAHERSPVQSTATSAP